MRFEAKKPQIEGLLPEYQMVTDIESEYVEKNIDDTAGRITVQLYRHDPSDQRIKNIKKSDKPVFQQ
jgi:hypothetical protein